MPTAYAARRLDVSRKDWGSIPTCHCVLTHVATWAGVLEATTVLARFALHEVKTARGPLEVTMLWLRPDAKPVRIHLGELEKGADDCRPAGT